MKTITSYINEAFRLRDDTNVQMIPSSVHELKNIIEKRYEKYGVGTKQTPISFNDINVVNITEFNNLFSEMKFQYIDISDWKTENVESMENMFSRCYELVSIGDVSKWNLNSVKNIKCMFYYCKSLKRVDLSDWKFSDELRDSGGMFLGCKELIDVGDIGNWNLENAVSVYGMFLGCNNLEHIGDISNWNLRNIRSMGDMFKGCKKLKDVGDITKWGKPIKFKTKNDMFFEDIFIDSGIKTIPYWYK